MKKQKLYRHSTIKSDWFKKLSFALKTNFELATSTFENENKKVSKSV